MDVHYIFHPSTIWVRPPVYGARAEKPLQNADFAMKQTNICRLSGDIIITGVTASLWVMWFFSLAIVIEIFFLVDVVT